MSLKEHAIFQERNNILRNGNKLVPYSADTQLFPNKHVTYLRPAKSAGFGTSRFADTSERSIQTVVHEVTGSSLGKRCHLYCCFATPQRFKKDGGFNEEGLLTLVHASSLASICKLTVGSFWGQKGGGGGGGGGTTESNHALMQTNYIDVARKANISLYALSERVDVSRSYQTPSPFPHVRPQTSESTYVVLQAKTQNTPISNIYDESLAEHSESAELDALPSLRRLLLSGVKPWPLFMLTLSLNPGYGFLAIAIVVAIAFPPLSFIVVNYIIRLLTLTRTTRSPLPYIRAHSLLLFRLTLFLLGS
ncbi:hypothetical protein FB446DRAFT_771538 [Lentinula raphanica]|nr:hypothetical protein FB446DRAFT_771538 [Lentinula raphanica]